MRLSWTRRSGVALAALVAVVAAGCAGAPNALPPVSGPGASPGGAGAAPGVQVQPLGGEGDIRALPAQPGAGAPAPVASMRSSNPAVLALLDSADAQAASGDLERASATLERALRIEPQDPAIWHDLAQVRLLQSDLAQAEALAQRSNALASGNEALQARNWRLIERVRRAQGNIPQADQAAARAVVLERR